MTDRQRDEGQANFLRVISIHCWMCGYDGSPPHEHTQEEYAAWLQAGSPRAEIQITTRDFLTPEEHGRLFHQCITRGEHPDHQLTWRLLRERAHLADENRRLKEEVNSAEIVLDRAGAPKTIHNPYDANEDRLNLGGRIVRWLDPKNTGAWVRAGQAEARAEWYKQGLELITRRVAGPGFKIARDFLAEQK